MAIFNNTKDGKFNYTIYDNNGFETQSAKGLDIEVQPTLIAGFAMLGLEITYINN